MEKLKPLGPKGTKPLKGMARVTGLEPATSGVTGRHSNRLSYTRALTPTTRRCVVARWIKAFGGECQAHVMRFPASLPRFFAKPAKLVPELTLRHFDLSLRSRAEPLKRPPRIGRLAQLVERFVYTEDVGSSSLSSPTSPSDLEQSLRAAAGITPVRQHSCGNKSHAPCVVRSDIMDATVCSHGFYPPFPGFWPYARPKQPTSGQSGEPIFGRTGGRNDDQARHRPGARLRGIQNRTGDGSQHP